ncbi:hypothetical protein ACQ7AI_09090 [Lactococcus petauri]|uniref:Uncharacterized protein n=1 Tax=Lactococcus garvieae TaxID=1363 RepID=A0A6L2ZXY3_9LACT|nr:MULTISPECIES: hypothetical protein [Lactococcus]GFO52367.1 hypothetical protein ikelab_16420 [Lactococcus garvieae]
MKKNKFKQITIGLVAGVTLLTAVSPVLVASANDFTAQDSNITSMNFDNDHNTAGKNDVFEQVQGKANSLSNTEIASNVEVTTITNKDSDTVTAVKIDNQESKSYTTIVNSGDSIIVSKSIFDQNTQEYNVETKVFKNDNDNNEANSVMMARGWSAWKYTNIAVGSRAFAYAVDTAVIGLGTAAMTAALPGAIAAAAGCSVAAARGFVSFTAGVGFGYLATIKSPGQWLSNKLDTNKNGWIGIYYRQTANRTQWKTI